MKKTTTRTAWAAALTAVLVLGGSTATSAAPIAGAASPAAGSSATTGVALAGKPQPARSVQASDPSDMPELSIDLERSTDGTAEWDDLDGGDDNRIVRTNDTITYVAHIVSAGSHTDSTLRMTLPQGVVLQAVPGFCKSGSTVTPTAQQIGNPTVPLTNTSWQGLAPQTLTCALGAQANTDFDYEITAKVRPELPNGHVVNATATVTSASLPGVAVDATLSHTIAAAPRYDISKNGVVPLPSDGSQQNNGPLWLHQVPCTWDTNVLCQRITYPLWVTTPNGGKGVSPATTLSFTDDLTPEKYFGAGVLSNPNWKPEYAPRIGGFWNSSHGIDPQPLSSGHDSSRLFSVRKSGNPQVVGTPGGAYTVTIDDADFSAWTVPTQSGVSRAPLPDLKNGGIISLGLFVEFPIQAIKDLGVSDGTYANLTVTNAFTDLQVTDIAGQQLTAGSDNPLNNTRAYQLRQRLDSDGPNVTVDKVWQRLLQNGSLQNISSANHAGDGVFMPGETVVSRVILRNATDKTSGTPDWNSIVCDYWNPRQFSLASDIPTRDAVVYVGDAALGSEMLRVQYGVHTISPDITVPGGVDPTVAGGCEDSRVTWYDSIAQVPGGQDAIGAVRAQVVVARDMSTPANNNSELHIMLTAAEDLAMNEILPNYASARSVMTARGSTAAWSDILAGVGAYPIAHTSNFTAADNTGNDLGDRAFTGELTAALNKQVQNRGGQWVDTVEPFAGGDNITFRLSPSLWAPVSGSESDAVMIEDCVPAGFTLSSSTRPYSLVSDASSSLSCAEGMTYIRWELGKVAVGDSAKLAPIEYTVRASSLIKAGVYRNIARITAQGDPAAANPAGWARVGDVQDVKIDAVKGVFLEKSVLTPVTQVNLPGHEMQQITSWEIRIGNLGDSNPQDVDIIDVLPLRSGTPGNAFNGTLTFANATITEPGHAQPTLYYTTASSVSNNPNDVSNWANGAVTGIWTEVRPADMTTITGVRLVRMGALADGEQIAFQLDMVGSGNQADNTYRNSATSVAHSIGGVLNSFAVSQVVSSQIGDRVWWDFNRNGIQDTFQGATEPGASGVTVRISGFDDLGNEVELDTATDSNGNYLFAGLRSSNSDGYVITFVAPDGASFTTKHAASSSIETDSDANAGGSTDSIVLSIDDANLTIDAGLVADGGLTLQKLAEGAGVEVFSASDSLTFAVDCSLDGLAIYEGTVIMHAPAAVGDSWTLTEIIDDLPVLSVCTITETVAGSADEAAEPVTVTVPFANGRGGVVTASLTNYYSAGILSVTKVLSGTDEAIAQAQSRKFAILVTCQVMEGDALADVFSGVLSFTGADTLRVLDATGGPAALPLGTRCFAEEVANGGAVKVAISHDSYANGVIVSSGAPNELQELSITVDNTFEYVPTPTDPTKPNVESDLAITGVQATSSTWLLGLIALVIGAGIITANRLARRQLHA